MKTSIAMDEIRKIRDENSIRRLSQTPEERKRELDESVKWFAAAIGKPVTIVTKDKHGCKHPKQVGKCSCL